MCDCISSNCPELGGKTHPLMAKIPSGLTDAGKLIGVDACIAPAVAALWSRGVSTHSNCCGHNGIFPRHIVVGWADREIARSILDSAGFFDITVSAWLNGCRHDDKEFDDTKFKSIMRALEGVSDHDG